MADLVRVGYLPRAWLAPPWIRDLRWLVRHRQQLVNERRLVGITQDNPMVTKPLTHAGIGLVTVCTLRAEIGRFDRFRSGKQVARFCGLTPRNASSGERAEQVMAYVANNPVRAGFAPK